jgi:ligand-binding sensor domain-containing protein
MLQDHRGYLWIGTFAGLARFDGERFTVFDSADMQSLGNNGILSLYESRSGVLWIGTLDTGLIRLDGGVATTYTERDGLPSRFVSSIRGDAQGNLFFNTSGGVAHFAGTKLEACGSGREETLCASDPMVPLRRCIPSSPAFFSSTKLATEASGLFLATGIGSCAITRGHSPM